MPAPYFAMIAQICNAFECTPTQALVELEEAPFGMVFNVIEAKAYMDAWRRVTDYNEEDNKKGMKFPTGDMVDAVMERKQKGLGR